LFICGTTGEGPLLSIPEKESIIKAVVDHVKGRVKVIVHSGEITTENSVRLSRIAQQHGADAIAVVLPYFYSLDEEALLEHFVKVANSVPDFPIYIYNIPQNTINNFSPVLLEKLLNRVKNIAGIKTSNPDLVQLQAYLARFNEKHSTFIGSDRYAMAGLAAGAQGIVSGNASAFPEPFIDLYQSVEKEDIKTARKQQSFINKLATVLKDGRYPGFYKKALELRGIKVGKVRAPHRELFPAEVKQLKNSLEVMSLI
jgi:4-hydroxy-tetrahydrodipicolinate synthase